MYKTDNVDLDYHAGYLYSCVIHKGKTCIVMVTAIM